MKRRLWSGMRGANGGTRTPDLLITNQVLYQLSYVGASRGVHPSVIRRAVRVSPLVRRAEARRLEMRRAGFEGNDRRQRTSGHEVQASSTAGRDVAHAPGQSALDDEGRGVTAAHDREGVALRTCVQHLDGT